MSSDARSIAGMRLMESWKLGGWRPSQMQGADWCVAWAVVLEHKHSNEEHRRTGGSE